MKPLQGLTESRPVVAGRKVRVLTRGSAGPAVFFDSALGTPAEEWDLVANRLDPEARLILWDRPGTGRSEGPVMDPGRFPDAAAELLGQGDAGPVVAVGHSMGGLNVLSLALAHPHLVAGLVLVDPSHPAQNQRMPASEGSSAKVEDWFIRLSHRVRQPPGWITGPVGAGLSLMGSAAAPLLARYSRGHGLLPQSASGVRLMAGMAPVVVANVWSFTAEASTYAPQLQAARDLLADRPFPAIPVVVLTGRQTQAPSPERARLWDDMHEELAGLSPLGRHIRLDCGHAIPFTHPSDVAAAIDQVRAQVANGCPPESPLPGGTDTAVTDDDS